MITTQPTSHVLCALKLVATVYSNWESIATGLQLLWQRKFITLSPTKHAINVSISRLFQQIQNPEAIYTYLGMRRNAGDIFIAVNSHARRMWGRI